LKPRNSFNKGYLIAFISAIVLSFTGILISTLSNDFKLPAVILAFWRDFLIAGVLLPILLIVNPELLKIKQNNLLFVGIFGGAIALFNIFWTLSVAMTGASIATVLVYSSGAFTALLGFLFLHESLGFSKMLAVLISFVGCLFVANAFNLSNWNINPGGIALGILSGFMYAVYSLLGRKAVQRGMNPWTTLFYSFLFAAIFLFIINLLPLNFLPSAKSLQELIFIRLEWRGWLLLFLLAAGPSLLGFGLYNVSLAHLPSSTANLILTFEPVMTGITAYFLLGERLTALQVVGSGLILTALLILRLIGKKPIKATIISS